MNGAFALPMAESAEPVEIQRIALAPELSVAWGNRQVDTGITTRTIQSVGVSHTRTDHLTTQLHGDLSGLVRSASAVGRDSPNAYHFLESAAAREHCRHPPSS